MAEASTNSEKKKKAFMIVGAVVVVGLIAGYFYRSYSRTHVTTDDAFIDGNIHTIAAKINGTVKIIYVNDNQAVKKGDLLVEIDPVDYSTRLQEAKSALGVERGKLSENEAKIELARANLELAKANLKLAETDKIRAERLIKEEVIPQEQYERMMTAFAVASAQLKAAEEQLRQAESQKVTQISTVQQKEAAKDIADFNVNYTMIYAPVDGYVTKKSVQVGNQIQSGQPLMAVVALKDIWITANYKETEMGDIRPGQRIPIKILLDEGTDKDHVLRIGMSVVPTVLTR
jgi:membrane fusion protein (multidrug efflux system)